MESEVEMLRDQFRRLGVPTHAHVPGQDAPTGACAPDELCVSEEDYTAAVVVDPVLGRNFHVDIMTAVEMLSGDADGAGRERAMAELAAADLGE